MSLDELLVEAGAELDRLSAAHAAQDRAEPAGSSRQRWLAVAAAAVVIASITGAIVATRDRDDSISVVTTPSVSMSPEPSTVDPPVSTAPPPTGVETISPRLWKTISPGATGAQVGMVEQRLAELGFEVGMVDGVFDAGLEQAVWAYQKLILGASPEQLEANDSASSVTPQTWDSMIQAHVIAPRRSMGAGTTHVEIYLPQQVLVVFTGDQAVLAAHISSGELDDAGQPQSWCETAVYDTNIDGFPIEPPTERSTCATSKTPGGVFEVTRKHDGQRISMLGAMYEPVYFNFGIAVHGAENVPTHRASHGAVRVANDVADRFTDLVDTGDRVYVWGEDGREPELYTRAESLPSFNRLPDGTTTTAAA